jgi:hypothetical protein
MTANFGVQAPHIQENAQNHIVIQPGDSITPTYTVKVSGYQNVQAPAVLIEGLAPCTFPPCHSLLVCLLTFYIFTH